MLSGLAAAWWLSVVLSGRAHPSNETAAPAPLAHAFAATPQPPYWAVIFTSTRAVGAEGGGDDDGYARAASRMEELARGMPGYLGAESVRDAGGVGVTVSYWRDEGCIRQWKAHAEHAAAQARGREQWYAGYTTRVAHVQRAYSFGDAHAAGSSSSGSSG